MVIDKENKINKFVNKNQTGIVEITEIIIDRLQMHKTNWIILSAVKISFIMKRQIYFGVVWLFVVSGLDSEPSGDLPCRYHDSINITLGVTYKNDTIRFRDFDFKPDRYVTKLWNGTDMPSTRGCFCDQVKCIRYCQQSDVPEDKKIKVINEKNQAEDKFLDKDFAVVRGTFGCSRQNSTDFDITKVSTCSVPIDRQQMTKI